MPLETGSISPSAAFAAMAASTALPPFLRMSIATWEASGCAVATMPCWASTGERVAQAAPEYRSPRSSCANAVLDTIPTAMTITPKLKRISYPLRSSHRAIGQSVQVRIDDSWAATLAAGSLDFGWLRNDSAFLGPEIHMAGGQAVLFEIALMIFLGAPEGGRHLDRSDDGPAKFSRGGQRRFLFMSDMLLLRPVREDYGPILGADVRPLAIK